VNVKIREMKTIRPRARTCVLKLVCVAALVLGCGASAGAQVSPNEILDPQLKALESEYFAGLKTINHEIARTGFPFPFNVNRAVGLDPAQQTEADTRGLEFRRFRDRVILKATGNYNAAYDSRQFTRNERAARTFRDVFLPILQIITRNIPPDVDCDSIGIEVAYHVRDVTKSYDYEGMEILVVVLDRKDAFQMVLEKDDNARQAILNRSLVYLGGQEYGLSLLDRDPTIVDQQARSRSNKIDATSTASASTSASRLLRSNPNLLPSASSGIPLDSNASTAPKVDLSQSKPAATPADAEKLQIQYQQQLDALSNAGQAKFGFVDYDPPTFVVVSKQMVLQMTMKNTTRYDPEKASLYKRAALTFDLFVAPKMRDVLDMIPGDVPVDYYDFSVVNPLVPSPSGKERSEAIEFLLPKNLAQKFANSEITNQELLDKGQVLVNGVRIALNLQLVE
jgi:hypothetical protein